MRRYGNPAMRTSLESRTFSSATAVSMAAYQSRHCVAVAGSYLSRTGAMHTMPAQPARQAKAPITITTQKRRSAIREHPKGCRWLQIIDSVGAVVLSFHVCVIPINCWCQNSETQALVRRYGYLCLKHRSNRRFTIWQLLKTLSKRRGDSNLRLIEDPITPARRLQFSTPVLQFVQSSIAARGGLGYSLRGAMTAHCVQACMRTGRIFCPNRNI